LFAFGLGTSNQLALAGKSICPTNCGTNSPRLTADTGDYDK
jgi:hypothetical protein